jgi:hypothetical protein
LELGTWNLELGTWNLELGTWNFLYPHQSIQEILIKFSKIRPISYPRIYFKKTFQIGLPWQFQGAMLESNGAIVP